MRFVRWLRGEEKFASLEALTAQIARDVAEARTWVFPAE
jgi:FAD synthase